MSLPPVLALLTAEALLALYTIHSAPAIIDSALQALQGAIL